MSNLRSARQRLHRSSLASATVISIPALFVLIWATGFVTARYVVPHAEPFAFVAARVVATTLVLAAITLVRPVRWPSRRRDWRDALVAGVLMQGIYIGSVFWAVSRGLPAGIMALVGSLQPLLTAMIAGPMLGERVGPRRWCGIGLGFLGAGFVLAPKLGSVDASGIPPFALVIGVVAMASMTLGTLWQKRTAGSADLLTNATIQFLGASLLTLPVALLFGDWRFNLGLPLAAGFAWSVVVNSVAGILLLMALIQRGAVAGVASLFFLVPPVSAVMAMALFGEVLSPVQVFGMAVAASGVALASRN